MKTVGDVLDAVGMVTKTIDDLQDVICGRNRNVDEVCDAAITLLESYRDMLREIPIKKS